MEEVDSTLAEEDSHIPGVEGNNPVVGDNNTVDLVASSVEASSAALAVEAFVEMASEASGLEAGTDLEEACVGLEEA